MRFAPFAARRDRVYWQGTQTTGGLQAGAACTRAGWAVGQQ